MFALNLPLVREVVAYALVHEAEQRTDVVPVLAALVAALDTIVPDIGQSVVRRCVRSFWRWKADLDKSKAAAATRLSRPSSARFLAHLVNQGVVGELVVLEMLLVLLEGSRPHTIAIETALHLLRDAGNHLCSRPALRAALEGTFTALRDAANERTDLPPRTRSALEALQEDRRRKFERNPAVPKDLALVDRDAANVTPHDASLEQDSSSSSSSSPRTTADDAVPTFAFDPAWKEKREAWARLRLAVLDNSFAEEGAKRSSSAAASSTALVPAAKAATPVAVNDLSQADVVAVRKRVYLTITASLGFEEMAHHIMRDRTQGMLRGHDEEVVGMIVEHCAQTQSYSKVFGLLGARLCKAIVPDYAKLFVAEFAKQYSECHRVDPNKLRNVALLFAHLLADEAMPWPETFAVVRLGEDSTNPASRIFLKTLFQDLARILGVDRLKKRLSPASNFAGMFPMTPGDTGRTRFAVNFFTAIGLGVLTDEMREFVKNPASSRPALPPAAAATATASSSSSSSSSSDSDSEDERRKRKRKHKKEERKSKKKSKSSSSE